MSQDEDQLKTRQLLSFFIPLGFSASLVTLSHVIINSTLTRAEQAEITLAAYAIAMSMFGITERPVTMLRQTCSALVRDRPSLQAMFSISWYVIMSLFALSFLIAYTPLGTWIFTSIFRVDDHLLSPILHTYKVLMFVSIFSGIRCFYHGIIIYQLRTKWLTIGMIVRLVVMYLLSLIFIQTNMISGTTGAIIFLSGMAIECLVSFWEGRRLTKGLPIKKENHTISTRSQIFGFYKPLLLSSFMAVVLGPAVNSFLGKTTDMALSIASYAIALSLTHLIMSFFSYMHQIVLNFYGRHARQVIRFSACLSILPTIMMAIFCFTPIGPWFLEHVMGTSGRLLAESLAILKIFMIMTLVFPWLDFSNGILMLRGQTHVMVKSQSANLISTITILLLLTLFSPGWNGLIGAWALSIGMTAELAVVIYVLRRYRTLSRSQPIPKKEAVNRS